MGFFYVNPVILNKFYIYFPNNNGENIIMDLRLNETLTPTRKSAPLIYVGIAVNPKSLLFDQTTFFCLAGKTEQSILKRYGKTADSFLWLGFEISALDNWQKIKTILNQAHSKARQKSAKGKQLEIPYNEEIINLGYPTKINKLGRLIEEYLIWILNIHFGKPLRRSREHWNFGMGYKSIKQCYEKISEILKDDVMTVTNQCFESTDISIDALKELHQDFYPELHSKIS